MSCWRSWSTSSLELLAGLGRGELVLLQVLAPGRPGRAAACRAAGCARCTTSSVISCRRASPDSLRLAGELVEALRAPCRRRRAAPGRCRRRRRRGRSARARPCACGASFSSISRMPWMRSPLRSRKPDCSIRRSAAFRSPWYSRSSVISAKTSSASSSNPTWRAVPPRVREPAGHRLGRLCARLHGSAKSRRVRRKSEAMPSVVAGTTPRSVMMRGDELGRGDVEGRVGGRRARRRRPGPCRRRPPAVAPTTVRTSSPDRSSIGIDAPSGQARSMVLHGAATRNGTPWARAASALR